LTANRLQRWALALSAYNYEIVYKKGSQNANADLFSRLPLETEPLVSECRVDFIDKLAITDKEIKVATEKDPVLRKVVYYTINGWPTEVDDYLIPYKNKRDSFTIENGCLISGYRVVIPTELRESILEELHADHIGVVRMKALARSFVWWPTIDRAIESRVKHCNDCQLKQRIPTESPLHPWPIANDVWERIHIDFAEKDGKTYLLGIDSFSRWPEICLVSNSTATKTIECMRHWFASYGLPKYVVSDNGPQFKSVEFETFLTKNGVKHVLTPPYHSASNGMAERLVRSFKESLEKSTHLSAVHKVQNFLYTYRNTPNSSTGVTPSELFLKRNIRTRLSLLKPSPKNNMLQQQAKQKEYHDSKIKKPLRELNVNDKILVHDPSYNSWNLGVITKRTGSVTYEVEVNGRKMLKHIDHLVKFHEPIKVDDGVAPMNDSGMQRNVDLDVTNVSNKPEREECRYPQRLRPETKRFRL
jgi:hypothetical protein